MALDLLTPDRFPAFPYDPPYQIQVDLMRHLYTAIEEKKVTIVESPTGTGKTLSLLCAGMTWLTDDMQRAKKGKLKIMMGDDNNAKDWVISQSIERARREIEMKELEYEERLQEAKKREAQMKKMASARYTKRAKRGTEPITIVADHNDDAFLPESADNSAQKEGEIYISPALRALMAKLDKGSGRNEEEGPTCTKIYYASRTHSQLSQVLPELQRLKLPARSQHRNDSDSFPSHVPRKRQSDSGDDDVVASSCSRTVTLGSRKQLCINEEVRASGRDLDESCREMLNEPEEKRCPHLPPMDDEVRMLDFRDQILATPKDIEDLAEAGRMTGLCPYFGSRRAIPGAELVTLPYNLLLQRSAREALGIDLTDQVVIIDEAHNLIPTLLSLSATRLSYATLTVSLQQLAAYISRFRTRLSGIHLVHLKRLLVFLDALKKYGLEWKESRTSGDNQNAEVMTIPKFMDHLGRKASGINLLEIEKYLKTSKVAWKISGYADKQAEKEAGPAASGYRRNGAIPPLCIVENFMLSLTGASEDGRVTISFSGTSAKPEVELRYQQLNPSPHFMEVVEAARSVILAGGTMSPISDVINQLFPNLQTERVTSFSCSHVIPENNLQALVVSKSPRGEPLDYKAGRQRESNVLDDLGQIMVNFACIVPAGMIAFFPSYNFLRTAKDCWQRTGKLNKLNERKEVFFEPEDNAQVEKVLTEYAFAAKKRSAEPTMSKKSGALLFAVVGAKLSEGLNFADDLARAVIIVGLPFANLGSVELQERLNYVKKQDENRPVSAGTTEMKRDAGAELYENMCMNAVNQSIGRAIRHKGDWASLILLDQRYANGSIRRKLPKWIENRVTVAQSFGQAMKELGAFYRNKRTQ